MKTLKPKWMDEGLPVLSTMTHCRHSLSPGGAQRDAMLHSLLRQLNEWCFRLPQPIFCAVSSGHLFFLSFYLFY